MLVTEYLKQLFNRDLQKISVLLIGNRFLDQLMIIPSALEIKYRIQNEEWRCL